MRFMQDSDQYIQVPALDFGPVRYSIGYIQCTIRPAETLLIKSEGCIEAAKPRSDLLYELSNGELILIIDKKSKSIELPDGVDGALRLLDDGKYEWIRHRVLDEFKSNIVADGINSVVKRIAATWQGRFHFKAEWSDGEISSQGLRQPQLGALHAIGAHWSLYHQPATVVMPTGTGKTETMLSTLAAFNCGPLLVVVPADALREQTARKFFTFGLLRKLGVLDKEASNPLVGIITKRPKSTSDLAIFADCNVVIATMAAVGDGKALIFASAIADKVGTLVVDEAHHIGAPGWAKFREAFSQRRILQFTATPFRRDGRLVDGTVIYNYPLRKAQEDGYFKPIDFEPVFEIDESLADRTVATAAIAKLRTDLAGGMNHLLMARCSNIDRAKSVWKLYAALAPDLAPLLVHSEIADTSAEITKLRTGTSRIVVCVNMLGEGFDLPELKIAAIHDLHKSLAILLQFTGRFTRSAGERIGKATVVANIADPRVSDALERLYSEDADWNLILSELSSEAAKAHARLVDFLSASKRLDEQGRDDEESISHQLIRPPLSTLVYECATFNPKNFHEGMPKNFSVRAAWLNEENKTLFFVTRTEPSLRWTRSKALLDREWHFFFLHFDEARQLMYLSSSDHTSSFDNLARAVGATSIVSGDVIFRSLGHINRLLFQNIGVKKHGRRNLRFAMYTGADVANALSVSEQAGSIKSNLSGSGWENGKRVTIGCSFKGRIWSVEQGSILDLANWCQSVGAKLRDDGIDTSKTIENVLIPQVIDTIPDKPVLSVEWPVEIIGQPESRVIFTKDNREIPLLFIELRFSYHDTVNKALCFEMVDTEDYVIASFRLKLDKAMGFKVESASNIIIKVGKIVAKLEEYLSDYPPLVRFVDLSELDGNLLIAPKSPQSYFIPDENFEIWDWNGVDRKRESLWKNGGERWDSIQWHAAQYFLSTGYSIVFDDDSAGEAADLICMNEEQDHIKLALVHCKFAGGAEAGERVKDVVEVCSQATRSAKWKWKFNDLCRHIISRYERLSTGRPSRFLAGSVSDINRIAKASRLKEVVVEILIVQPGLSKFNCTNDQAMVLAATTSYLKETIGVNLRIICDA